MTSPGNLRSIALMPLLEKPLLTVESGELLQAPLSASVLGQRDRDAIVEIERPAPLPDARRGRDMRDFTCGTASRSVHEIGDGAMRALAGDQQQRGHALRIERAHRRAGLVDHIMGAVALPDREGLALGDDDVELVGKFAQHACRARPNRDFRGAARPAPASKPISEPPGLHADRGEHRSPAPDGRGR